MTFDREPNAVAIGLCGAYCSHGGICDLEFGHKQLHSAGRGCTFTDEEAVSQLEGDAAFAAASSYTAQAYEDVIRAFFG